ncbi:MAG: tetratricopeptide repeat protein [Proteocatella sp.]
MRQIVVRMLDSPSVEFNGVPIHFPYKKVEGFFYYICINKKITREEAVKIFWADCSETVARKNLRDALYKIKKLFSSDIIQTLGNSLMCINSDFILSIDTDKFIKSNDITLYKSEFLSDFFIKNCYEFESWAEEKKTKFKAEYFNLANLKLDEFIALRDLNNIQKYGAILLQNDTYNENIYRKLMNTYASNGASNSAMKIYHDLCQVLEDDLNTTPENSTKILFENIANLKKNSDSDCCSKDNFFYGRHREIHEINNKIHNFGRKSSDSIIISGEAGIGKTYLLEKISNSIDDRYFIALNSTCYEAESKFFLKPWHCIFELLGEYILNYQIPLTTSQKEIVSYMFPSFNRNLNTNEFDATDILDVTRYQIATGAIEDLFISLSEYKKIVLVFDDIQWMDNMSLKLLENIILKVGSNRILLLATYREDFEDDLSRFTIPLFSREMLSEFKINRFSMDETKEIVSQIIPDKANDCDFIENIYQDTEGNALFLMELLKVVKEHGYTKELSSKATNIIRSRLINLSFIERNMLDNMSVFFDKFTIKELQVISMQNEMEMFDTIESLQSRYLIREVVCNNDIFYSFTHQKIREYIYNKQSAGKLRVLHKKIALYYEHDYLKHKDFNLCSGIIYHLGRSGDMYKYCKYKIDYMKEFYTIYHETYPIICFESSFAPLSNEDFEKHEKSMIILSDEINTLQEPYCDILYLKMEMSYIMGRYYISSGSYDLGIESINDCIDYSLKLNNTIYLLNCYKQLIFYSIQIENIESMKKYIDISFDLLEDNPNIEEFATILRLNGLYLFKTQEYTQAIQNLLNSIEIFEELNYKKAVYYLSIAACYNYLGQICKTLGNNEEACSYFNKAIEISNNKYRANGLGIFYSNVGQTLYEMGKFEEAKENIYKSIRCFKRNNSLWGREIAEAYAALLDLQDNNTESAISHYEIAKKISSTISNPATAALVESIYSILF